MNAARAGAERVSVCEESRLGLRHDARALEELRAYIEAIVRGWTDDIDEHEELVQIVLIKAWRGMDGFRRESAFRTWIYRVARNAFCSSLRARRAYTKMMAEIDAVQIGTRSRPLDDAALDRIEVERCLSRIPHAIRLIIELSVLEGMTSIEIGRYLGIAPGSVRSRLCKNRRLLASVDRGGRAQEPEADP